MVIVRPAVAPLHVKKPPVPVVPCEKRPAVIFSAELIKIDLPNVTVFAVLFIVKTST